MLVQNYWHDYNFHILKHENLPNYKKFVNIHFLKNSILENSIQNVPYLE